MKKLLLFFSFFLIGCTYQPKDTSLANMPATVYRDAMVLRENVDSGDIFIVEAKYKHYVFKETDGILECVAEYRLWDSGITAVLIGFICAIIFFIIGLLVGFEFNNTSISL
jgi:hypothetical protein